MSAESLQERVLAALGQDSALLTEWREATRRELLDELEAQGLLRVRARKNGKAQSSEEAEFLDWVWNRWLDVMGYRDRGLRLSKARREAALARYREGRTAEEFDEVLVWASTDPHLRGQNDRGVAYDDFDTLFGSPDKFEKYLTKARGRPATRRGSALVARNTETQGRRM